MEERLTKQAERLDVQRAALTVLRDRLDTAEPMVQRQRTKLRKQMEYQDALNSELHRLGVAYLVLQQQMASFETRLQQLIDADASDSLQAGDAERVEARSLLDEVRREHSQIRVRFGVVSRYEERVRRLEAAIEPTRDQYAPSSGTDSTG
jgi:predicted  nucleic acid-binding Zn-ribbon protein